EEEISMAKRAGKVSVREAERPSSELAPLGWPGGTLERLHDEIGRLFEDIGFGWPLTPFRRGVFDLEPFARFERALAPVGAPTPRVDITENEKEITVSAELPGLDEKDIGVVLSDDMLTIKGEKREEEEEKRKGYYVMERRYGSFQRSFRLPETVDRDRIDAAFERGILTIHMPKTAKAKTAEKKIKIKAKK
ncbi:MAG: Hsp20/alpha crystallin family protein, partial [Alphaproteobacteria bacterium]